MKKGTKKHPLEEKYPEQCAEYRKIADRLYKLFLDKGMEYGVNNVRALGPLGLSLRMFEKIIRALNLLGWNPWEGKFTGTITKPKFDSVEKEFDDVANISIIALIMSRGKWAK